MKILALIPARGGSKGVPGKNIKLLAGRPLIEYTIAAAVKSELLTDIVVSTDSPDIARIAEKAGAEVPFMRPITLASDTTSTIDVIVHALDCLNKSGKEYDAVCLLQPTCPFRAEGFIDLAIDRFTDCGSDSLISVLSVPEKYNPHWTFEELDDHLLKLVTGENEIISRRQLLPKVYHRDGSLYLTCTEVITKMHSLYGRSIGYIVSEHVYHVNIDNLEDWRAAEEIVLVLKEGKLKEFDYLFKG
ncbi:MAG: acylneuraminate cytidylyltransferase family protein [Bacteroidales bacterium]|jgi:CMP-N-acetylneuraminic acid synthetase|nr:acylneuraminate cytidylyltransferase family protein [Bacteroidales bacterium]OQB56913.1 MAG: CMP-N,N'-diacetyllegionaminic acid synthase [Bacteroidetes bacterium ADurb.Bin145]